MHLKFCFQLIAFLSYSHKQQQQQQVICVVVDVMCAGVH